MKTTNKSITLFISVLILLPALAPGQNYYETLRGDPNARKKHVHSGNQIRTTFFNYGLIGRENSAEDFGGEWPINTGHFYVGDISVMVGAEINLPDGRIITPVTVADGPRGSNEEDPLNTTIFWGWEPLPDFDNPDTTVVAMSHRPKSWPATWPDRAGDLTDPGWAGQWNGFFGKGQFNADQESFWVMDDSRDMEWIRNRDFYPDSTDESRGGLALLANVRGLQWSQTLAQNTIFWLYDVTNIGTTNYDKAVFGMIVGTIIGGDGDTNDDNSEFDAEEDLTYSWDFDNIGSTGWSPVGYLGYAFLESPGNKVNGIDEDGDFTTSGPTITSEMLTAKIATVGEQVVTIDYSIPKFPRTVIDFPAEGVSITANGTTMQILPGDTLFELPANNIDDNLNGLIDENTEIVDGIDNNFNGLIDETNPNLGSRFLDYIGGSTSDRMIDEGRDDGIDNDGDWTREIDDVGLDGKANTFDIGEGDGFPTSGYTVDPITGESFDTGLPGEPNIDKTDIDESDQVGLTSFYFFAPFNLVRLRNDDQLWSTLRPGFFNSGEQNKDGDFIYGTGYFPLRVGQTERISIAFFFADNLNGIFRTKETVQLIYDNDYNFAKAPILPTLKAYAGDGKVALYWDRAAELSYDRLSDIVTGNGFDFEGYKIYRSTFPTWEETGTVTNVWGSRVSDVPITQFDIVNADSGFFPAIDPQNGAVFYLGDNEGLVHTFIDTSVNNGFSYFYAVTSYDHGIFQREIIVDGSGNPVLQEQILQPAESSKFAAINPDGNIELGQNVIVARPEAPAAGFIPPPNPMESLDQVSGDGSGSVFTEVIDPSELKDLHTYEISFADDGAFLATTESFSVIDITAGANDSLIIENPDLDVDATVFDGIRLSIFNIEGTRANQSQVTWTDTTRNILPIDPTSGWKRFQAGLASGVSYPANYQLEVGEMGVDTTVGIPLFGLPIMPVVKPVNFRLKNTSEDYYIRFDLYDNPPGADGVLDQADLVVMFENNGTREVLTYKVEMSTDTTSELPQIGDILLLPVDKPFLSYDKFQFSTETAKEDKALAKEQLSNVKVVPNPYIAVAAWEPRNNFSNGRGDRRIHFTHLPRKCTIRIYNLRGELVARIDHDSPVTDGTADWDLLTLDQLEVAYGVYIYHIDAPGVGERIDKFAIIK
jgi:hypothetical protein